MDGVVIDSEKLYSLSETNLLMNYGVSFDDSDWAFIKGCTETQFYDMVYKKFNPPIKRNLLVSKGRKMLKKTFTEKLGYMEGFLDIYSKIRKHYKCALVTSTGEDLVNHIDTILNIKEKFDIVITSKNTSKHKPFPDPYIRAIKLFGLKASNCLVVEDSIQGIQSGKAAGCPVVALEGSFSRKDLSDADHIISSLLDIDNIL